MLAILLPLRDMNQVKPKVKKDNKAMIIGELARLASTHQQSGDRVKAVGYRKTIALFRAHPDPIYGDDDLDGIKLGAKIKQRVKDMIAKGQIT